MTTFGTFDIDSVTAPSDFELEAMDAARPKFYDFNRACTLLNINEERLAFDDWCRRMVNLGKVHSADVWKQYRDTFRREERSKLQLSIKAMEQHAKDAADLLNMQDARGVPKDDWQDQHDTQQDALGTLY